MANFSRSAYSNAKLLPTVSQRTVVVVAALLLLGMVIGSIFDLPISQYLTANWADATRVFSILDSSHYSIVIIIAAGLLAGSLVHSHRSLKPGWLILLCLLLLATGGFIVLSLFIYEAEIWLNLSLLTYCLIILVICALSFILGQVLSKYCNAQLTLAIAAAGCLFLLIDNVLVYELKGVWERLRFYAMTDPVTQFSPWFEPGFMRNAPSLNTGDNEAFRSFPSGHALAVANLLWLALFAQYSKNASRRKTISIIIVALLTIWLILVMVSRIAGGFHYLSDVVFGAGLALLCLWLTLKLLNKVQFYKVESNKYLQ